jgi:hypothetical protein
MPIPSGKESVKQQDNSTVCRKNEPKTSQLIGQVRREVTVHIRRRKVYLGNAFERLKLESAMFELQKSCDMGLEGRSLISSLICLRAVHKFYSNFNSVHILASDPSCN